MSARASHRQPGLTKVATTAAEMMVVTMAMIGTIGTTAMMTTGEAVPVVAPALKTHRPGK